MRENKKFIIFFVISTIFYSLLFLIEPLRRRYGENSLTLRNDGLFYLLVLALLVNLFLYIYFFRKSNLSALSFKKIFYYYLGLNLILLFVWPIGSNDIFSYIYQGRIFSIFHANPYLASYSQFSSDEFFRLIANRWIFKPAPYGPVFIFLSAFLAWLGKASLYFSLFLFKALFVAANLLSAYLLYKLGSLKTFYLYAFNPLVIFEFVINGHNDVLLVLACLLCLLLLTKNSGLKNYLLSFLFLLLSGLIKLTTIIFWPVWLLLALKKIGNKRRPLLAALAALISALALSMAFYAPGRQALIDFYSALAKQNSLSYFYSLTIFIFNKFFIFFNAVKGLKISLVLSRLIFSLVYVYLLLRIIFLKSNNLKGGLKDNLIKYQTWILLFFFLTFFTWIMPWYFTLLIALSALAYNLKKEKFYLNILYFFSLYGIIYYVFLR